MSKEIYEPGEQPGFRQTQSELLANQPIPCEGMQDWRELVRHGQLGRANEEIPVSRSDVSCGTYETIQEKMNLDKEETNSHDTSRDELQTERNTPHVVTSWDMNTHSVVDEVRDHDSSSNLMDVLVRRLENDIPGTYHDLE